MGLVELVAQEEIAPPCLRLLGGSTANTFIGVKRLKSLNAGVEGAVLGWLISRCTVPAAVIELLAEEVVDEVVEAASLVPVSGREPHQHRHNARLRHLPSGLPLPEALTPGECRRMPRWQAKPDQVKEGVRRGNPFRRVVAAAPAPVGVLQRNQLRAPALRRDPVPLVAHGRCRAAEHVSVHPPANRRVALEQPVDQLFLCGGHRHHPARGDQPPDRRLGLGFRRQRHLVRRGEGEHSLLDVLLLLQLAFHPP